MLAVVGMSFTLAFFSEYIAVDMERRGFLAVFMISMDPVEADGYLEQYTMKMSCPGGAAGSLQVYHLSLHRIIN